MDRRETLCFTAASCTAFRNSGVSRTPPYPESNNTRWTAAGSVASSARHPFPEVSLVALEGATGGRFRNSSRWSFPGSFEQPQANRAAITSAAIWVDDLVRTPCTFPIRSFEFVASVAVAIHYILVDAQFFVLKIH
jgi:hypothetical protein